MKFILNYIRKETWSPYVAGDLARRGGHPGGLAEQQPAGRFGGV